MTAPLYLNHENNSISLHVITNKILNAIDDDEFEKLERHIDEAFRHDASAMFILMLYRYAEEIRQPDSCFYLRQIMVTAYNF